jgi:L-fucose isomerase-like protein
VRCNLALRDVLIEAARRHGLDAFAFQTFDSVPNRIGAFLQFGCSLVAEAGYPMACETDVHGAISTVLLKAASATGGPVFMPDVAARHPEDDNAVLLWHTDAPPSLRRAGSEVVVDLPWILKGLPAGLVHFPLRDGPVTLCRFDGDPSGGYRLGAGQGHTTEGPYTQEYYAWLKVENWAAWERRLIQGPYIHHCACCFDHCAAVLAEACRFIPGLGFEALDGPGA